MFNLSSRHDITNLRSVCQSSSDVTWLLQQTIISHRNKEGKMSSWAILICLLGFFQVFPGVVAVYDGQEFTYKYLGTDFNILHLQCQPPQYFTDSNIIMITIYNTTTMTKMAQVLDGRCPTIEDPLNYKHLYLPGCSPVQEHRVMALTILITNTDPAAVQTFLCNLTIQSEQDKPISTVWAITVQRPDSTKTTDTDYTEHLWLPLSAYKIITSLDRQVKVLEPSMIAVGVMLTVILISLGVQMFLSCKIIRFLEYRRAPKQYQLTRSQSKMTDHSKSGPLEEDPFYASV
uniref:Uncharacterized protein n=4 Tax=Arion vulgaris TaxID=1028688 RepID=A0A0B7AA31_9EUPU